VPTVIRKDTEKMNAPTAHGPPNVPRPEAEAKLLKESISLLGESSPWEEDIIGLATFEDYKED
jgi:hypothetical protein